MAHTPQGYKEKVTDEQLVNLIESGIQNSLGDWLNSSDLTQERQKSTYEYAGMAVGHLTPNGVSSIVDTSTTETVEAYTALLTDLFLNNGKLARFVPYTEGPNAFKTARDASMITNYCIFKQNNGWEILQTWIKSALLWKNGVVRWDYIEDFEYKFEEYDRISQIKLDEILADENVEIVGDLEFENSVVGDADPFNAQEMNVELVYVNVRLKRKVDKSRVKIENVPPENFRISRDAKSLDDANFVGVQTQMTRSEIRKYWSDVAENIAEDEWDEMTGTPWLGAARYSQDMAARKFVTGQNYLTDFSDYEMPLEANREVTVTECWIRVDRDGDGVAELKHFITAGSHILAEEDCSMIPLASLSPIDIPFEFYGLSIADFTRSSTLAATAILRGFVENTYLTNYSPKLADPNVVDFSALQNMKPKQIIPTNGNPAAAVAQLQPETISTGTVPLLQHLQLIKEQATGMSKAAQGLNDTLYVSGNSEAKLNAVQSASQKRIQHIARRFAETGMKRLCQGVYMTMRDCMKEMKFHYQGIYATVNADALPYDLDVEVFLDLGENSNKTRLDKLNMVGSQILPQLNQAGAGMIVKPEAPAVLATKIMEAMGVDSNDFLEDYTTDEFKQKAAQSLEQQSQAKQVEQEMIQKKAAVDLALQEANVSYTNAQAKNTSDDNIKQLAVALDKHQQEWAELAIKAVKEGAQIPPAPNFEDLLMMAKQAIDMSNTPMPPQQPEQGMQPQGQPQPTDEELMAMMQQGGMG
jgi:hypothetical protein